MDIDPAIAEAMGFSGFGTQTTKKRKHGSEDAFVGAQAASTGSNKEPIGSRDAGASKAAPAHKKSGGPPEHLATQTDADGKPTLDALRHGVKNENGDMVYFLPSFLEDPWKDLRPR